MRFCDIISTCAPGGHLWDAPALQHQKNQTMITLTTDYKRESITETFPTIDDATTAYADADWSACHQPGNDIRRITLRIDGATVKTKTY